ncbi:signal recognition particle receptor, isoform CRA_a [Gorgonomyces haynaldii]|nr:signal recognition particle receptor, isoform CRA_a [Gorgonomyces haynaldii]
MIEHTLDKPKEKKPRSFQESKKFKKIQETKGKQKDSKKEMREWDASGAATTHSKKQLDFSADDDGNRDASQFLGDAQGTFQNGVYETLELEMPVKKESSSVLSYFGSFATGKPLDEKTLDPAMVKMKEHLIQRNVAAETSTHLCETVKKNLIGKKMGTLVSLDSQIKQEMRQALAQVLTPHASIDILRDIQQAKKQKRPFTMAFVGVNGVGKSTNLSKICFWLLQNKLSVLIAACDTFRAGAVEQLRVHVKNLSRLKDGSRVELFDKGYGKDPAGIAKDAISYGYDVVLIDTAGRMQDNEPLMRALAKLVATNDPDKIVFVGEALVGNEAVDQVRKFNQSIQDFSGRASARTIDGMVLSKFDTIDEKVGAAVSLSFTTGRPILFVGTGQTYTDLRKMNVDSIVETLLK